MEQSSGYSKKNCRLIAISFNLLRNRSTTDAPLDEYLANLRSYEGPRERPLNGAWQRFVSRLADSPEHNDGEVEDDVWRYEEHEEENGHDEGFAGE